MDRNHLIAKNVHEFKKKKNLFCISYCWKVKCPILEFPVLSIISSNLNKMASTFFIVNYQILFSIYLLFFPLLNCNLRAHLNVSISCTF